MTTKTATPTVDATVDVTVNTAAAKAKLRESVMAWLKAHDYNKPLSRGGITVTIEHDCMNWDFMRDSMCPMSVYSSGTTLIRDCAELHNPLDFIDVEAHATEIYNALGTKESDLRDHCRLDDDDAIDSDTLLNFFRDVLYDLNEKTWRGQIAYFDTLESLWTLAGYTAITAQKNGYCQGDALRFLAVATDTYFEDTGIAKDTPPNELKKCLESEIQEYADWAFGNVYWYNVELFGEHVDSCGGYIGDIDESGILDAIADSVMSALADSATSFDSARAKLDESLEEHNEAWADFAEAAKTA